MLQTRPNLTGRWPAIAKQPGNWRVSPNLIDYERARAEFSWVKACADLTGLPGGSSTERLLPVALLIKPSRWRSARCRI